jgi:hypothetical protein
MMSLFPVLQKGNKALYVYYKETGMAVTQVTKIAFFLKKRV